MTVYPHRSIRPPLVPTALLRSSATGGIGARTPDVDDDNLSHTHHTGQAVLRFLVEEAIRQVQFSSSDGQAGDEFRIGIGVSAGKGVSK